MGKMFPLQTVYFTLQTVKLVLHQLLSDFRTAAILYFFINVPFRRWQQKNANTTCNNKDIQPSHFKFHSFPLFVFVDSLPILAE